MKARTRAQASILGAIAGALAVAAACGAPEQAAPAPPASGEAEPVEIAAAPERPAPGEPGPPAGVDHTIGEGETLWDIARAYGVGVQAIMEANELDDRDVRRLRRGSVLRIPGATEIVAVQTAVHRAEQANAPLPEITGAAWHRLVEGETLWDVARLYDVSVDAILERNELDDDSVRLLRPGHALQIPGVTARQIERATANRNAPRSSRVFRHEVSRGETIWSLAASFGVSVAEIMAANRLSADEATGLRAGASIVIPGVERNYSGQMRRAMTTGQRRALALAARLGLGSHRAGGELLNGRPHPTWVREASRGSVRNRLPGTLRWPVSNGWYVRGYGSGEGGYHLATDIMGQIGWPVRASAAGLVGYAGDEIPGYGNVVLLIHAGGWITMYAHNSVNLVVAGERVPAGGIIAEVGSTGISRGPHVHFELIFRGENCDPAALWRPGIRHRNGRHTPLELLSWTQADERPEAIRCHRRMLHPRSRWVIHEEL